MVIAVSVLSGALFVCVALFLLVKFLPPKMANDAYYKRHLGIVEAQLQVFNERMWEKPKQSRLKSVTHCCCWNMRVA